MVFVSVFTIQRTAVEILSVRHPSSVFFANRFRSAACQKIQLPPGGSQGAVAGAGSIQRSALFHPQMGGCAASGRQVGDPYRVQQKPLDCSSQRGTLPQPRFARQLPQRGSQGHFVPAGRQVGDPYGGREEGKGTSCRGTAGGYEPPLRVRWKPGDCAVPGMGAGSNRSLRKSRLSKWNRR